LIQLHSDSIPCNGAVEIRLRCRVKTGNGRALKVAREADDGFTLRLRHEVRIRRSVILGERWSLAGSANAAALELTRLCAILPVLSEGQYIAYSGILQRAGLLPAPTEHNRQAVLGQTYADIHRWPQLAATITEVYRSLPTRERAQAAIVASNYGEASAVCFRSARSAAGVERPQSVLPVGYARRER
jgi:hypothetical protein